MSKDESLSVSGTLWLGCLCLACADSLIHDNYRHRKKGDWWTSFVLTFDTLWG